ncbi:MAG TPA: ATP synthase F1 subunit delta, partial [Vicinamibacteria bacterium]|nr:ATP synthase F1 subunit delta [Vicinamibacteria bacterium]
MVRPARRPPLPLEPGALARRYARALLDVARQQKGVSLHELQDELLGFAQLMETNGELRRAVLSPALPAEARRRVLAALAGRAGASPLVHRLLELLVSHERLEQLPAIAEAVRDALDALEGRVRGEAVTAVPLGEPQRSALAVALRGAVSRTVELENRVDPAVLGGVLVRIAGRSF